MPNVKALIMLDKSKEHLKIAEIAFDHELYNPVAQAAYYACFQLACVALDYHKNEIYPISSVRNCTHKGIISGFVRYLINENQIIPMELRGYLKELESFRITADYEAVSSIDRVTAEKILKKALYFYRRVTESLS
ncbi:MAG: HEPN domain-containing protein [Thiotrichaceae bacterium]|nr:HEPN domain-containing protein [Thiotrichaceae bacterium]